MERLTLPVEEYTTPDPVTAQEGTTIEELGRMMKDFGVRHIPILKGKQIVGIVSERDLKVVAGLDIKEKSLIRATDVMARDPITVDSEETLDEVAFKMSTLKIGSVIVKEGGELLGIFTVTDALNALIEITRGESVE